jgi:hypothetical protein
VPTIGASCSTVCSIIARCSRARSRPWARAAPQKRRDVSLHLDQPTRLRQLRLRTLGTAAQLGELPLAPIGRLTGARPPERLERARLRLLAPLRQMRAVQPLAAHERADLTRPRARLRLPQDPQRVLRAEPTPQRPIHQLRVRRGSAAGRFAPLAYGSLHQAAASPIHIPLQDHNTTPISRSSSINMSSRPSHTSLAERARPAPSTRSTATRSRDSRSS